jgi:hypothetical protein
MSEIDASPEPTTEILWAAAGKPLTGIGGGRYTLTKDLLVFEKGTLSLKRQQIATYEIHDVDVSQTMAQKIRGIGTISLFAVRETGKEKVLLEDIPDVRGAAAKINEVAHWARDQRMTKQTTSTVNYVGTGPNTTSGAQQSASLDLNAELAKLASFKELGVLDEDEFKAAKAKLLGM